MKLNSKAKWFAVSLICVLVLSVGMIAVAKNNNSFKTKELVALENHKADLEMKGKAVPEEIKKKIELETNESEKLQAEKSKRQQEVLELKLKFEKAPKDEKGNPIIEYIPTNQKPEPYGEVGKIGNEKHARTFFPSYFKDRYNFSTTITAPYNILISGTLKENEKTGFIYYVNGDSSTIKDKESRIEFLYNDVGEIKFEMLIDDNIAIFSYGNGNKGYFDISKTTSFFTPYSKN